MSSSWSSWPRPQKENEEDVGPGKQNVRAASTKEKLKVGFFKPLNGLQAWTFEMWATENTNILQNPDYLSHSLVYFK